VWHSVIVLQARLLVNLGCFHLLEGLVAYGLCCEARKMLVRGFTMGYRAHPMGDVKSNTSRARCEEHQVVDPNQMLDTCVSTPHM
jgi:hypothetical protein